MAGMLSEPPATTQGWSLCTAHPTGSVWYTTAQCPACQLLLPIRQLLRHMRANAQHICHHRTREQHLEAIERLAREAGIARE